MSKEDAAVLAGRALAVLFTVWALSEVSFLPEGVYSLVRYAHRVPTTTEWTDYQYHHYLIDVVFRITRIIGFALIAGSTMAGRKLSNC